MPPQSQPVSRLAYIDWMRGLACVLMFQWHCYNSWLRPEARKSWFYAWSQLGGTLPAPLFIFLAGISFALVTRKLREKGMARDAVAKATIFRGAEIYALGFAFRVQEFVLGYPNSPWTDLFRVDVLNILGMSMMLMGVLCWLTAPSAPIPTHSPGPQLPSSANWRTRSIAGGLVVAAAVALLTPLLWTTGKLNALPWPVASYFNGVHTFHQPQPWLFPLFPWSAFAFAGLAVGFFLFSDFAKRREIPTLAALGAAGVAASLVSIAFDASPIRLYAADIYDYWHTSPNFFLMRCGILLVILFLAFAWCRWGLAQVGFSPLIQLGKTSLLVYWVHIEFVYGRLSFLPKGRCGIAKASVGLLAVFLAMLALSIWRTTRKNHSARVLQRGPRPAAATAESG